MLEIFEDRPDIRAFFDVIHTINQTADGIADGDIDPKEGMGKLLWATCVALPSDPFFAAYKSSLVPIMAGAIVTWDASNRWGNEDGDAHTFAFVRRWDLEMLIPVVAGLVKGYDGARVANETYFRAARAEQPDNLADWRP
jgi:hypothetical protein